MCKWRKKRNNEIFIPQCSLCKKNPIKFIRKFKIKLLPSEYMLSIEDTCAQVLISSHGLNYYEDKMHFVNLPRELALTKYDYKLCEQCYKIHKKKTINEYPDYYYYKEHFNNGDFLWTEWEHII
ncbi:MAG: hypothetical protein Terrestrivirus2_33 [Terrestrivirus sp.]|jgi:hypothetical protein|uniref:Uncharacterized protein n=1 Tax=Terrestrivirus sp. TaxID=2487775 RepID=A0A3G4ZL13_9VIRU|nr:MAG: hypothetical protein Terrestrivirus2_33 [Terrestrivirus sp.]